MQALTLEVIQRVVFGSRDDELRDALRAALDMTQLDPEPDRRCRSCSATSARARRSARSSRRRAASTPCSPTAIAHPGARLRAGRAEGHAGASEQELRDQLVTLLAAGHETTATALAWALERLARHPARARRAPGRRRPDLTPSSTRSCACAPSCSIASRLVARAVHDRRPHAPARASTSAPACTSPTGARTSGRDPTAFQPGALPERRAGAVHLRPVRRRHPPLPGRRVRRAGDARGAARGRPRGSRCAPNAAQGERMRRRSITLAPARGGTDRPRRASVIAAMPGMFCRHNRLTVEVPDLLARAGGGPAQQGAGPGQRRREPGATAPRSCTAAPAAVRAPRHAQARPRGRRRLPQPARPRPARHGRRRAPRRRAHAAPPRASSRPGPYPALAEEPDLEQATWLGVPARARAGAAATRCWRPTRRGARTPSCPPALGPHGAAYRAWVERAGSQAAAFTGDAGWTPQRRFGRVFERLALPGFGRGKPLRAAGRARRRRPLRAGGRRAALRRGRRHDARRQARARVRRPHAAGAPRARPGGGVPSLPLGALDRGLASGARPASTSISRPSRRRASPRRSACGDRPPHRSLRAGCSSGSSRRRRRDAAPAAARAAVAAAAGSAASRSPRSRCCAAACRPTTRGPGSSGAARSPTSTSRPSPARRGSRCRCSSPRRSRLPATTARRCCGSWSPAPAASWRSPWPTGSRRGWPGRWPGVIAAVALILCDDFIRNFAPRQLRGHPRRARPVGGRAPPRRPPQRRVPARHRRLADPPGGVAVHRALRRSS